MRNLKKVLTLVLTLAMLLSVMVVGAGAATFGDQESITNKEAVDVCTTLNIIGGYEDGTFRPTGNVTRAEMSKMICVALNGGQEPTMGSGLIATFNDVAKDHWAAPYIEYCVSQGIVGGVGGGNFNPTGNITGTQAAKMLLCILGYNASIQGYVGSDYWETNINVDAAQKGLYAGLTNLDASAPLTRDQAAQMIWNALNAYEVEYKTTLVAGPDGTLTSKVTVQDKVVNAQNDKITLLEDKYEAKTFVGTFNGNSDFLTSLKDGQIQVTGDINSNGASGNFVAKFPFDLDMKYVGEEVKVLYLDKSNDGTKYQPDEKDTIYGVYITGKTTVYNIVKNDIQKVDQTNHKIKFNDTEYKYVTGQTNIAAPGDPVNNVNNGNIYTNYINSAVTMDDVPMAALEKQSGDTIKLIANDSGDIVTAYVVNSKLAKVNSVNSDTVSLSGVGAIDIEDNNIYSGIAKDDVVVVTTYFNGDPTNENAYTVVTRAETVSGTLDGYKTTETVTVNGTTYNIKDKDLTGGLTDDPVITFSTGSIGKEVTLYLVNGFVDAIDMPASVSSYAVVMDTDTSGGNAGSLNEFRMKVMLADGSEKTVTVDEDSAYAGDRTSAAIPVGSLVKYASISNSNVMDLTDVISRNATDMTKVSNSSAAVYDKDLKTFVGQMTDTDAVLFARVISDGSSKYYAYNIRSLNDISVVSIDATSDNERFYAYDTKDGKVVVAYVELNDSKPSGSTSNTIYGIVGERIGTVEVNGEKKEQYKVFNNNGEYIVNLPAGNTSVEKGDIVYFDKTSDDVYKPTDMKTAYTVGYIKEMDKDNVLSYYTSVSKVGNDWVGNSLNHVKLADDAQIVYVNQDGDNAGTDIGANSPFDPITGYANVIVVMDGGKAAAIIIESSNKADIAAATKATVALPDGGLTDGNQSEVVTVTITNPNFTGVFGDYTATLKDSAGTAPTGVTAATTALADGVLTVTLTEGGSNNLSTGTYTLEITKDGTTTTYTLGI